MKEKLLRTSVWAFTVGALSTAAWIGHESIEARQAGNTAQTNAEAAYERGAIETGDAYSQAASASEDAQMYATVVAAASLGLAFAVQGGYRMGLVAKAAMRQPQPPIMPGGLPRRGQV